MTAGRRGRKRGALLTPVLLLALPLAGCVGGIGSSNFEIRPTRMGWNAGEEATFTLILQSSIPSRAPSYEVDPDFALEEIRLDEKGVSLSGEHRTRNPADLDFRFEANGTPVRAKNLTLDDPSVGIALRLPDDLHDSQYFLELRLFKVGWIRSEPFRVNRP